MARKQCKNKQRFKNYSEALNFAEDYNSQVPVKFHPMEPYFCVRHNLWHIGHNSFIRQEFDIGPGVLENGDGKAIL